MQALLLMCLVVTLGVVYRWNDREDLPLLVYAVAVIAVLGVGEALRPGVWPELQYDHPVAAALATGGFFAGMAAFSGRPAPFVALMAGVGVLVAVVTRPSLKRGVERERSAPGDDRQQDT